jgi:hypothetical protein
MGNNGNRFVHGPLNNGASAENQSNNGVDHVSSYAGAHRQGPEGPGTVVQPRVGAARAVSDCSVQAASDRLFQSYGCIAMLQPVHRLCCAAWVRIWHRADALRRCSETVRYLGYSRQAVMTAIEKHALWCLFLDDQALPSADTRGWRRRWQRRSAIWSTEGEEESTGTDGSPRKGGCQHASSTCHQQRVVTDHEQSLSRQVGA